MGCEDTKTFTSVEAMGSLTKTGRSLDYWQESADCLWKHVDYQPRYQPQILRDKFISVHAMHMYLHNTCYQCVHGHMHSNMQTRLALNHIYKHIYHRCLHALQVKGSYDVWLLHLVWVQGRTVQMLYKLHAYFDFMPSWSHLKYFDLCD